MKKVLGSILLVVYSIIAITVTVLLLSYNEYNCSEIGGYTVFILGNDSLEPDYNQGTILIVKGTSDKNIQTGDEIFLYKVINSQEYELVNRTLVSKVQQGTHITYVVDNEGTEESYASEYFIGKASDTIVIEGWGYILGLLESKWGYLFCVVIVSLLLFLQEVFELVMEIKYNKELAREKERALEVEGTVDSRNARTVRRVNNAGGARSESDRTVTRTSGAVRKTDESRASGTTRKTGTSRTSTTATKTSVAKEPSTVHKTSSTRTTSTASNASKTAKSSTATSTRKTTSSARTSATTGARKVTRTATTKAVEENKEANVEEE